MKFMQWFFAVLLATILGGCGGGGGDSGESLFNPGGTPGGTTATGAVVTLSLSSGVVSSAAPVIATATVKSTNGAAIQGVNVSFSTIGNVATLNTSSGTTDGNGVVTVLLSATSGASVGTDTLTASATVNSIVATARQSFTANSASTIEVLGSSNAIGSAGEQVTITAIVKAAGNVGLANAPVIFTADSGTLSSPSPVTDATGVASVRFSAGANKSNRNAVITVVSGASSGQLTLPIQGTKLSVSGVTTTALGASVALAVTAVDSTGNAISGAVLTTSSSLGNGLLPTSLITDTNGQATVNYTASVAGTDTVTFRGLGGSATSIQTISSEDFSFVLPPASTKIPVGIVQDVRLQYRVNGLAVPGRTINFSTTGGSFSPITPTASTSATTDAVGIARVSLVSTSAAPATVQAQLVGGTAQATLPVVFVAITPARLVLQVTPVAIGPNAGNDITKQAQVLAKVTDANGNPVAGATVNFSRVLDPSGGNLLQPSAITDVNGQASVQFASGPQSTASDGVNLRGEVAGVASVFDSTSLTVSQSALFIALGTGNTITNIDPQTYRKDWTAYVTDANGVAVPNITLTAKVLPQSYRKGQMFFDLIDNVWKVGAFRSCPNEDLLLGALDPRSFNGVLDSGEDFNNSKKLEPGNVIALTAGSLKTDANGRATLSLVYAESYVPWVEVRLQVQAIVSGTASITSADFVVAGASEDFADKAIAPAGQFSPFGVELDCTNTR